MFAGIKLPMVSIFAGLLQCCHAFVNPGGSRVPVQVAPPELGRTRVATHSSRLVGERVRAEGQLYTLPGDVRSYCRKFDLAGTPSSRSSLLRRAKGD